MTEERKKEISNPTFFLKKIERITKKAERKEGGEKEAFQTFFLHALFPCICNLYLPNCIPMLEKP